MTTRYTVTIQVEVHDEAQLLKYAVEMASKDGVSLSFARAYLSEDVERCIKEMFNPLGDTGTTIMSMDVKED